MEPILTLDGDLEAAIIAEASVLSPTLHDALASALLVSKRACTGIPYERFPALLPMYVRAALRLKLESTELTRGWQVAGNPRQMSQLMLSNPYLGIDMRFLKERRRSRPGGIPAAGPSRVRRSVWTDHALNLRDNLHLDLGLSKPALTGPTSLLWVWDLDGKADDLEGGFTQRVVHTLAPGSYGKAVPCDLSLDLLPGGGILDRLRYVGADENEDLYAASQVELAESADDE